MTPSVLARTTARSTVASTVLGGYPHRTLLGWCALLAIIWLAFFSPWSLGWNIAVGVVVFACAAVAIVVATRKALARANATQPVLRKIDGALNALPADIKRNTPLVLVGATTETLSARVFGNESVLITDTAIWVRVSDPAQCAHFADSLKRWRECQGPDALALLIDADAANDQATLTGALRRWRSAAGEASRALGYSMPACVAVYVSERRPTSDECPWFGVSGPSDSTFAGFPETLAARLDSYTNMAIPEEREARARRAARLDIAARWTSAAVLPILVEEARGMRPMSVCAAGLMAVAGKPAHDSLLAKFACGVTSLALTQRGSNYTAESTRYPLPEPLIRGIASQHVERPYLRALAHAFLALVALFCAASAASAWQNRHLAERVSGDIARYEAIPVSMDSARVDALNAVRRDRDQLNDYATNGVPPRLGLGFYRAGPSLPVANALIAGYQPPAPAPTMIELSSLSLFKSGSAVLNPGSNRVLVGALDLIKANPSKRVLIAGHTDSVGDSRSNLALSEARAASVRDWLADASGISTTRFAIQGYGDTRPKASNETEAGRAANRRVEITLVPECRDDRKNGASPEGHASNVACSFN